MLSYYAQMYGVDAATFASYYGYETVEEYAQHSAEHELTHAMLFEKLASDLGITHTDEEVDAALTEYMEENELTDTYTLEEFKEANGEAWLNSYKNYEMNREPVLEALKDRVVIVESEPETEAEAEGEAETAE